MSLSTFAFQVDPIHNQNEMKWDEGSTNVWGEPVFNSVMAAGWFCEKSGWIRKVEDVKPVRFKKKRILIGNHFDKEDFYLDGLWNRWNTSNFIHLGLDIIWF